MLADELTRHDRPEDALLRYEAIRRPRAELALKLSLRADRAAQLTNPVGRRLRNYVVKHTPTHAHVRQLEPLVHDPLPSSADTRQGDTPPIKVAPARGRGAPSRGTA